jgi:NAD(P)H-quinone oxidoreductase subunit 5
MSYDAIFHVLGYGTILAPFVLLTVIGLSMLFDVRLSERATCRWTQVAVVTGLSMAIGVLLLMLISGTRNVSIDVGNLMVIHEEHFHFHLRLMFDRLSVPFAILSFVLVGTIGAFAQRYLHREPGFHRFFLLYAVFLLGMIVASLAGTIEMLFLGWELVGLSSALLVAYFQERTAPVVNGQRVWSIYRVADAAFLIAAVTMHHMTGEGDFSKLVGQGPWPEGVAALTSREALFVGLLLLIAAAGKSALIPFSGWLPRAMEGPTPSSAVFYGALSVHLGAFLLLRVSPILDLSTVLCAAVVTLGLATAIFAAMTARVQTDVKNALAFASLTQVGIITAEIGLGFRYIALIHIIGHACMRTVQLVRAPSLLHDYRNLENAIGSRLPTRDGASRWLPQRMRVALYRFAFQRGSLDASIDAYIVRPFMAVFHSCDGLERRWTDLLSGSPSRESDRVPPLPPIVEEPL